MSPHNALGNFELGHVLSVDQSKIFIRDKTNFQENTQISWIQFRSECREKAKNFEGNFSEKMLFFLKAVVFSSAIVFVHGKLFYLYIYVFIIIMYLFVFCCVKAFSRKQFQEKAKVTFGYNNKKIQKK